MDEIKLDNLGILRLIFEFGLCARFFFGTMEELSDDAELREWSDDRFIVETKSLAAALSPLPKMVSHSTLQLQSSRHFIC